MADFVSIWQTTTSNETITIRTDGGGYNYDIDWGDSSPVESLTSGNPSHIYSSSGTYTITISGIFPRVFFSNQTTSDKLKLLEITTLGDVGWTSMQNAFNGCHSLSSVGDGNLSGVSDMEACFLSCFNLTTISSSLDLSNVTDMSGCFENCIALTSIPLFDLSNVADMDACFGGCFNLTSIPLFDLSGTTSASGCFSRCSSLTSVPFFNLSNLIDAGGIFDDCSSLTTVPLFDLSSATNITRCFRDCSGLTSVPLFDLSNIIEMEGCFNRCSSLTTVPLFDLSSVINMKDCFLDCSSLTTMSSFDLSSVIDMEGCFQNCSSLTTVPLFDLSSATIMKDCFHDSGITSIPLLNLSNVVDMTRCFRDTVLTSVPLFDLSSVQNMEDCFRNTNLITTPLFNLSSVTDMTGCFFLVGTLTTIPLFDLSSVQDMTNCFSGTSLTTSPLFNLSSATNVSRCFSNSDLATLPLFNLSNVTNVSHFVSGCNLTEIPTGFGLNLGSMTNGEDLFEGNLLSTDSYSNFLNELKSSNINTNVSLHGGSSYYEQSAVMAREVLTSELNWTITDNGLVEFVCSYYDLADSSVRYFKLDKEANHRDEQSSSGARRICTDEKNKGHYTNFTDTNYLKYEEYAFSFTEGIIRISGHMIRSVSTQCIVSNGDVAPYYLSLSSSGDLLLGYRSSLDQEQEITLTNFTDEQYVDFSVRIRSIDDEIQIIDNISASYNNTISTTITDVLRASDQDDILIGRNYNLGSPMTSVKLETISFYEIKVDNINYFEYEFDFNINNEEQKNPEFLDKELIAINAPSTLKPQFYGCVFGSNFNPFDHSYSSLIGDLGKSINFYSQTSEIDLITSPINGSSEFSFSMWILPKNVIGIGEPVILGLGPPTPSLPDLKQLILYIDNEGILNLKGNTTVQNDDIDLQVANYTVENDKLFNVLVTYYNSTVRVYINGELKTTQNTVGSNLIYLQDPSHPSTAEEGDNQLLIGDHSGGSFQELEAILDEILFFDYALTPDQISCLSNRTRKILSAIFSHKKGNNIMSYNKNEANQHIVCSLTNKEDVDFTGLGDVTCSISIGANAYFSSSGTLALDANGTTNYQMTQEETNADFSRFVFGHPQSYGTTSMNVEFSTSTGDYSTHSASDVAELILENTGNLLLTNPAGEVTTSNPAAGGGSAHTAEDVATLILQNTGNPLLTDSSGFVTTTGGNLTTEDITGSMELTLNNNSQIGLIETMRGTDDALLDSSYTVAPSVGDIASSILENTGNPLLTDINGYVTTNQEIPTETGIASYILENPTYKITTNISGQVEIDSSSMPTNWDFLEISTDGRVSCDVKKINSVTITGDGSIPSRFGV